MSSNTGIPPTASNKTSSPSIVSNYSQTPTFTTSEFVQKRSNSSGSFGAGSQTRGAPQARSAQPAKNKHKAQRRARLVDDDAIEETDAMKSINSRRGQTSITHLMNFSLPPRPYQLPPHQLSHRYQRRNPTWGLGSGYHAVDKARYVHANYRFIVRPDGDYQVHASDTDVHLNWDKVMQILASSDTQSTNCPICLSVPVAPRMAKCGHIFCLPCLIRYMHAGEEDIQEKRARWKKCPICEDSVYVSETRPVRWFVGQEANMLREGGDVLLRLLMRAPGTTLALPRDAAENYGQADDVPWFNVAEMMDYARIMKGGEAYMSAQHEKEIEELRTQELADELMFGDDNTWTQKAIASIEQAKQRLVGIGNPPSEKRQTVGHVDEVPDSWDQETNDDVSTVSTGLHHLSLSTEGRAPPGSKHGSRSRSHAFFFYHALPNFFLSPLDIRILKTAFGDFSCFPSTILPRVEHISTGHVVDDDLRKRAKYMGHLPYGCEVSFLECDWTDIISPAILDQFEDDIVRRRKRNHEKEAREERDRVRAEKVEEEQRYSAARRRRPSMADKSFSEMDFQPLVAPSASSQDDTFATTPPWGNHRTQSSFATLGSPGTSPDAARTIWGTAIIPPLSPVIAPLPQQDNTDDGWLQGWERDLLSEGDAVAMVEASLNGEGSVKVSASGGQKKRKGKKITLMSTTQRRGA